MYWVIFPFLADLYKYTFFKSHLKLCLHHPKHNLSHYKLDQHTCKLKNTLPCLLWSLHLCSYMHSFFRPPQLQKQGSSSGLTRLLCFPLFERFSETWGTSSYDPSQVWGFLRPFLSDLSASPSICFSVTECTCTLVFLLSSDIKNRITNVQCQIHVCIT